jgi:hypothetical protein
MPSQSRTHKHGEEERQKRSDYVASMPSDQENRRMQSESNKIPPSKSKPEQLKESSDS